MGTVTPDDARTLLTAEALALLDGLPTLDSAEAVLRASTRLHRAGHDPALIAAVLTQARLRRQARPKLGEFGERMLLTEDGLQQATRLPVAAAHAARMRHADIRRVADLGCGIGADSLAFAAADLEVLAVDAGPVTAAFASFNLAPWPEVEVRQAMAQEIDLAAVLNEAPEEPTGAVFLDPARRVTTSAASAQSSTARRTWNPDEFSPSLDWVFDVAAHYPTGVKLGPGLPHELIPDEAEAEWVSDHGDVVEVSLWFGALAERPGVHSALLHDDEGWHRVLADGVDPEPGPVRHWIYEPDGAAIRARALGTLAARHGLNTIDSSIAYLSGDDFVLSPFLRAYEVLEVLPFDRRKIKTRLSELGVRRVTVKKRGADIDPAAFAKEINRQLGKRQPGKASGSRQLPELGVGHAAARAEPVQAGGSGDAIVFVTRVAGRHRAIITRRP